VRTSLPPLCKGRWIRRQAKTEGLQVSIVFSAADLLAKITIPQSPPATAPFTQGSLWGWTSLPPLCKGRWICRQAKTEGLQVSIVFSAADLLAKITIPQSPPATAPFTQVSLWGADFSASLVQREVDSPSGEDGGIAGFDCFFCCRPFSENYNPSVASGDSSLYTREPLSADFTASLVRRKPFRRKRPMHFA